MSSFIVHGGNHLKGTIIPQGAKNEALQILSAVLLTSEPITVNNIPDILDVNLLIEFAMRNFNVFYKMLRAKLYIFCVLKVWP